jgi:hypothetical protein
MAADAVDEFLGTLAPNKPQGAQVNLAFDAAKLVWQDKLGPKGPYQICTETDNPEFKRMMTILEAGGDRTTHLGMFYWIMTGRTAVARKPRK